MDNKLVYKANALIEASYRISLNEQRLILACIAQIRKDEELTDQKMYNVSAADFLKFANMDLSTAYAALKQASDRLMRREVWIRDEPNGNGVRKNQDFLRWAQRCSYFDGEGRIEIRFSKDILPYLNNLSSHFTKYTLSDIYDMDSWYAIRLYELLIQYEKIGSREITVNQLRYFLGLEDKYKLINNLRRRVIDIALEQINTSTSYVVSCEPVKKGRRIHAFLFTIKDTAPAKPKAESSNTPNPMRISWEQAKYMANRGETKNELLDRLRASGYTVS